MKQLLFLIFLISTNILGQVIISPYIIYMDQRDRFGTFIVQNESLDEFEINISFVFGYPDSDSLGNISMTYHEEPNDSLPSIVEWLRAFPRSFILSPNQKQIVRMTVRPPDSLEAGTYWTRMVTSSSPKAPSIDTLTEGISAKIRFVLNQVTTVMYRVDSATTGLHINNMTTKIDSTKLTVFAKLNKEGNSPFLGNLYARIISENSDTVSTREEFVQVYFDQIRKVEFPIEELSPGKYSAEFEVVFNEKEDIPKSRMMPDKTVYKEKVEFNILQQ